MARVPSFAPGAAEPSVPDGRIHHWVGAVFIPGVTLDQVLALPEGPRRARIGGVRRRAELEALSRDGDRLRVYMKLRRESVITVTYNTEHDVEYRRLSDTRASSRSVATKIAELDSAGTPQEREKPAGNDHGFLWRLNAYWRYEQVKDGVVIECESVSLSRSVPVLLRPFVTGTVERIARESLQKTLVSLRTELGQAHVRRSVNGRWRLCDRMATTDGSCLRARSKSLGGETPTSDPHEHCNTRFHSCRKRTIIHTDTNFRRLIRLAVMQRSITERPPD